MELILWVLGLEFSPSGKDSDLLEKITITFEAH